MTIISFVFIVIFPSFLLPIKKTVLFPVVFHSLPSYEDSVITTSQTEGSKQLTKGKMN